MNATIFYAPDAIGSVANYFFDGVHMYERVHGLGSLGALHGWLKRIGKTIKKGLKKVGKVIKKVNKVVFKVIKKALPIVNTVLSFVPVYGWVAKAALTAVEMGIKAYDNAKTKKRKRKLAKQNLQKQMKNWNKRTTRIAKPAIPVKQVNPVSQIKTNPVRKVKLSAPPPVFTAADFIKVNEAVNRNRVTPEQVAMLSRQFHQDRLQALLKY